MSKPRNSSNSDATVSNSELVMDVREANAQYLLPAERQIPKGYKQTEVGVIPEDWELASIEDVAQITTGSKNTQDKIEDGEYPFFVRSQTVEHINSYSYDGEAVLTAGDGVGTGKVFHYIRGKFDAHQRVYRISEFSSRLNGYFFYLYFSNHFYNRIMQMTAKSSVDSVRREMIAKMLIPLPPTKAEQEAIAEALSDADALIEALEQLIAKKRQLKQGAMQELLTGKRRLAGFIGEWSIKRLGEIADIDSDNLGSDTDPSLNFNYISLEDVDKGVIRSYSEHVFQTAPSRARRKLRMADILVSTVRPNLMSHLLFLAEKGHWICSTGFSVVRCRQEVSSPAYVYFHLFANAVTKQIETLLTGSNYPAINSGDVRSLMIPFPTYKEQTAIAQILTDMDAEITELESKLSKARAFKQGMMQQLLTGKIRLVVNPKPIIDNGYKRDGPIES
jgi:type I restriction enzyme, S subunit